MCTNAVKTAASLMEAIEPTIKSLLTETGLINTPAAQTALTEYDDALTAIQNWQSGTPAQEALEAIGIFQTAFNALPLPATVETLTNIVLAGIETVIGVLTANSPAPAAPAAPKAAEAKPAAPMAAPAAPMATGNATFQMSVDAKYAKETAGKARMHSCLDQYNANKTTNGNGGLKWIQKGGGYYSECNKRLKG